MIWQLEKIERISRKKGGECWIMANRSKERIMGNGELEGIKRELKGIERISRIRQRGGGKQRGYRQRRKKQQVVKKNKEKVKNSQDQNHNNH